MMDIRIVIRDEWVRTHLEGSAKNAGLTAREKVFVEALYDLLCEHYPQYHIYSAMEAAGTPELVR